MINALLLMPFACKTTKSWETKGLLEIKNQITVLDYQIQQLKTIDKDIAITLATGFNSLKIQDWILHKRYKNIDYINNKEHNSTNEGCSLKLFLSNKQNLENIVIINSGVLIKKSIISKKQLKGNSKFFMISATKENFGLGCTNTERLEYIFYDLPNSWSEFVYLNKEAIDNMKNIVLNNYVNHMYLFEILNQLLNTNIVTEKTTINKKDIMKILTYKDINKAKNFI
jgi:hypothetical protein